LIPAAVFWALQDQGRSRKKVEESHKSKHVVYIPFKLMTIVLLPNRIELLLLLLLDCCSSMIRAAAAAGQLPDSRHKFMIFEYCTDDLVAVISAVPAADSSIIWH
jgi:hypothetical protein